jgi:hypothetical protein
MSWAVVELLTQLIAEGRAGFVRRVLGAKLN